MSGRHRPRRAAHAAPVDVAGVLMALVIALLVVAAGVTLLILAPMGSL